MTDFLNLLNIHCKYDYLTFLYLYFFLLLTYSCQLGFWISCCRQMHRFMQGTGTVLANKHACKQHSLYR